MKTTAELKAAVAAAERELRFANLRRQWTERRLLEAPTELEFDSLLAELASIEGEIADLSLEVMCARSAWAQAADKDRRAAPG